MSFKNTYRRGQFYRICDRSGFKVYSGTTKEEWNGLMVREKDWEPRHPQDFIRGKRDHQSVPMASPESTDTFLTDNEVTRDSL